MSGSNHATTRILKKPKKNYDLTNNYRLSIYLSDKTVSWLVQNKILWIFALLEMERNAPVFSEIVKSFKPAKKYTSSARINRLPASLTWFMMRVFPMVVASRLLHVEVGPNDHRKTHSSLYFYLSFEIFSLSFSFDGEHLISANDNDELELFQVADGAIHRTLHSKKYGVANVNYTHHHTQVIYSRNFSSSTKQNFYKNFKRHQLIEIF